MRLAVVVNVWLWCSGMTAPAWAQQPESSPALQRVRVSLQNPSIPFTLTAPRWEGPGRTRLGIVTLVPPQHRGEMVRVSGTGWRARGPAPFAALAPPGSAVPNERHVKMFNGWCVTLDKGSPIALDSARGRVLRVSCRGLLVSQRHHWINSRRSPRWQVTRDERDEHQ